MEPPLWRSRDWRVNWIPFSMLNIDERSYRALEIGKIKTSLEKLCLTPMGREKARALEASSDVVRIRRGLRETREALEAIRLAPSLRETEDIEERLERAEKGGMLDERDILAIRDFIRISAEVKEFFLSNREKVPLLSSYARRIGDFDHLLEAIERSVDEEGFIKDGASERMREIRENIRRIRATIQGKLGEMISDPAILRCLREPLITLREGRFCLPVRSEYRGRIEGIVHSTSASGATLFIEPLIIVEDGNRLREWEKKEEEERTRILRQLSGKVRERRDGLRRTREALGLLDFCLAKGLLALQQNAVEPVFDEEGVLSISKGRHPFLPASIAVPVSLEMGRDERVLIITGPNTGGKTTTLKMVGLFVFMGQAGLFIPASEGTTLPIFQSLLADIGEEQSIEQNLSTFSSHITQVINILRNIKGKSLVLLDELGAGTDPAEGSALARAIVEELASQPHIKLLVATHFGELKLLPYIYPYIKNASFEFDPVTLRPTFRLIMGVAGSSHAIEVARRLGLGEEISGRAEMYLGEREPYGGILGRIKEEVEKWEEERRRLEAEREELSRLKEEYEERLKRLEEEEERILEEARAKARALLHEVEEKAREVRKGKAGRREWRELLERLQPRVKVKEGDRVAITTLRKEGVVREVREDAVVVEVEGKKLQVPLDEVRPLPKEEVETVAPTPPPTQVRSPVMREVNLRGMRVEDALFELEKVLDKAYLEGVERIRVIHGKGTGTLRRAIWDYLKDHPLVKSLRTGEVWEGSYGATIVELK